MIRLRLGARGSALSIAQAELVRSALAPGVEVKIVTVRTTGDRLSAAGSPIEWKGDFTTELDAALAERRIDLAVHSLKDVPSAVPEGILLAAVPPREDPSDVLVAHPRRRFAELPQRARIGTSSPRRRAQLRAARPDLDVVEARGNVDTRITRLKEGRWDAIVLARAGLARLDRLSEICEVFSPEVLLPAVGQGALGVFARAGDRATLEAVAAIDDPIAHREALAERALLATLEAGCRGPVAARARSRDSEIELTARVLSADGTASLCESAVGGAANPEALGRAVARRLLDRGAASWIGEGRS